MKSHTLEMFMRNSLIAFACGLCAMAIPLDLSFFSASASVSASIAQARIAFAEPLTAAPVTAFPEVVQTVATPTPLSKKLIKGSGTPVRVRVAAAGIDSSVIPVGLNGAGEMDVPDGDSDLVGWYKGGTVPGNIGSAVFDAHVFAAFEPLHRVAIGSEILVDTKSGDTLRFIVEEVRVYALKDISAERLFNRRDARRLNLITCAGSYVPSLGTYDHRLIVYARLA